MGAYTHWFYESRRKKSPILSYVRKIRGKLKRHFSLTNPPTPEQLKQRWLARSEFLLPGLENSKRDTLLPLPARPKVLHLIGSLQSGGAERQLCNCVIGMHKRGYEVTVLLIYPPAAEHGHYLELLHAAGVPIRVAGKQFNPEFETAVNQLPGGEACLASIPHEFRTFCIDVLGELLTQPPDILHTWLDHSNIWGGVAAIFANIPLIVLSTRNVNPSHFPYLNDPYFEVLYSKLAQSPKVRFINNSRAGAEDYANWLGLPESRFSVVLNGVDYQGLARAGEEQIADFREAEGIPGGAAIIAGVFRLSEEKQPLVFLQVIKRLIGRRLPVVAVIAGVGPLEHEVRTFIAENGLDASVFLLGRRSDVATIFSAATLKLLCSRQEGTPNVLLEAQWLGCPVVSTKAGGAADAVADGETGFLVEVGDLDRLEASVTALLEDPALRQRMAEAGPAFIQNRFDSDRMVRETLSIYNLTN